MTIQATITVENEGYTIQWDGEPPPVGRYRMLSVPTGLYVPLSSYVEYTDGTWVEGKQPAPNESGSPSREVYGSD